MSVPDLPEALKHAGLDDVQVYRPVQESFDWEDEAQWGEHPDVTCGIENPEVCESCT